MFLKCSLAALDKDVEEGLVSVCCFQEKEGRGERPEEEGFQLHHLGINP